MKTSVEPLEGNKVKLSVEVEELEFEKAVDAALRKIARDVRIPGFRPGKAPRKLLEARMGKEGLRQEAMREALPDYYAEALRLTEVDAIAPPEIDVTAGQEDGPLAFDAVVEVRPQITLVGYQGLQVTVPSPVVSDEELRKQIDRLRTPFGELKEVERPIQDGDHVTIDLEGVREGEPVPGLSAEDYLYEVGTDSLVPGADDRLRGAAKGAALEFESPFGEVDGEAQTVTISLVVKDVKEMILPEVTDDWAGEASEFETVAELEADLRTRMGMVRKVQANMAVRDEAVKALVDLVEDEVPDALVNAEMERRLHDLAHRLEAQGATIQQYLEATGQPQEQLVDDLRSTGIDAVKADLALRALADAEGLDVSDEDLDAEIVQLAGRMKQAPEALREQLERADQIPAVRSDIRKAKALGWLMEHVEIVDEEGNPIDRADLSPDPVEDDETVTTANADEETEDAE
ncbi:MAG TPA: trigger factor [Acidimicrobiales bacterium]|nr:trigger factor [Acidimicrobiales bacterium]